MVDTLGDRLGESAPTLQGALAQIRLAFVELSDKAAATPTDGNGTKGGPPAG
jgi:hypothetical protein